MKQDNLKTLLTKAERTAPLLRLSSADDLTQDIYQRVRRRRAIRTLSSIAATVVLIFATSLWLVNFENHRRIVAVERRLALLQTQTNETLEFVKDVLTNQKRGDRLYALESELISLGYNLKKHEADSDKNASKLLILADRMYNDLSQKDSAIQTYRQLMIMYPENRWAVEAKKRLTEIENQNDKGQNSKGDTI